ERNQYSVVPFDTFERYLGPRYENIPGVEYILENGTLLYFMESRVMRIFPVWSTFWKMERCSTSWRRLQACTSLPTTPLPANRQPQNCLSPFMRGMKCSPTLLPKSAPVNSLPPSPIFL